MAAACFCSCKKEGPTTVTLDFEGNSWKALVDKPQYGGPLLYGNPVDEAYHFRSTYSWRDGSTTLEFPGFPESWGSVSYSSGGEAISNYVSSKYEDKDFNSQLEVPVAPKKGKIFVVHYGDADPTATKGKGSESPEYSMIRFADNKARVIQSIDVCMTNYFINACLKGNKYFGPISGKTELYANAYGLDANGKPAKTASYRLIDGRDADSYRSGVRKFAWEKWDLTSLGAVYGIIFTVSGTPDCYDSDSGYFNAPSYFAYDNIVVEMSVNK